MEEGKEVVKLIHGNKIVEDKETDAGITDENVKLMLEKAKKFNEQGIHWHHHMLFPDCIFNSCNVLPPELLPDAAGVADAVLLVTLVSVIFMLFICEDNAEI